MKPQYESSWKSELREREHCVKYTTNGSDYWRFNISSQYFAVLAVKHLSGSCFVKIKIN